MLELAREDIGTSSLRVEEVVIRLVIRQSRATQVLLTTYMFNVKTIQLIWARDLRDHTQQGLSSKPLILLPTIPPKEEIKP
jgi:hypothetical protein